MKREHNLSNLVPLQYLECTGTQWIDTGFKLNQDSRVVIDFRITKYQTTWSSAAAPFGARYAYGNNMFQIFCPVNRSSDVYFCWNNAFYMFRNYNILNSPITLDANKNVWTININGNVATYTFTNNNFQNQGNCYLFKGNFYNEMPNTNGIDVNDNSHKIISKFDIYDNDTQVRKYRPYLNAGEPGMLDEINNVWYGNNGTGQFLYA